MPSNQQEGAPYPADMEHLEQILAIGSGHKLPEGADVTSVTPAVEYTNTTPEPGGTSSLLRQATQPYDNTSQTTRAFQERLSTGIQTPNLETFQLSDLNFDEISRPLESRIQ